MWAVPTRLTAAAGKVSSGQKNGGERGFSPRTMVSLGYEINSKYKSLTYHLAIWCDGHKIDCPDRFVLFGATAHPELAHVVIHHGLKRSLQTGFVGLADARCCAAHAFCKGTCGDVAFNTFIAGGLVGLIENIEVFLDQGRAHISRGWHDLRDHNAANFFAQRRE